MEAGLTNSLALASKPPARPAPAAGDRKGQELVRVDRKTQGPHARLVGLAAADHLTEGRIDQPSAEQGEAQQQDQAEIVELPVVGEVQAGDPVSSPKRQAVLAAIGPEGHEKEEGHLRKGQGDHDEIDPAGAQADRAHEKREAGR